MHYLKPTLLATALISLPLFQNTIVHAAGVTLVNPSTGTQFSTQDNITLSWNAVSGSTAYRYLISTSPTFGDNFVDLLNNSYCQGSSDCYTEDTKHDPSLTTVTITPEMFQLQPNTTYYWKVRTNAPGVRDWSDTWQFTTDGAGKLALEGIIYAYHDEGRNNSQLIAIDLKNGTVTPIGPEYIGADLEGLAMHEGVLYATSSDDSVDYSEASILYRVNTTSGALTAIGSTGMQSIDSLTSCNGMLVGWSRGNGLVGLDASTGQAELLLSSTDIDVEGLSCNEEIIYATYHNSLYSVQLRLPEPEQQVKLVCENLPADVETIEVLSNGTALYASANELYQLQLSSCEKTFVSNLAIYNDIEGLGFENAQQCVPNDEAIDFLFVLDLSGSMTWGFAGSGSRLEAIQRTLTQLNEAIATRNDGSRVSLVSFKDRNQTEVLFDYTDDFELANAQILEAEPLSSTPMASGVKRARELLASSHNPEHRQVVILISDGVPTYDLENFGYDHTEVEAISLMDANGVFLTPDQVRELGRLDSRGRTAGMPLAEIMEELNKFFDVVANPTIHAVALQPAEGTGSFNDHILQYAAHLGKGIMTSATSLEELDNAFTQIAETTGTCSTQAF